MAEQSSRIGKIYTNKSGDEFQVISKNSNGTFHIRFLETGFENDISKDMIRNGATIRDHSKNPKKNVINIGDIKTNNEGYEYEIIEKIKTQWYKVKFAISGYETEVKESSIINGTIRDRLSPTKYGVGILGYKTKYTSKSKIGKLWGDIISYCYNPNDKSYPNNGGKGVTVCERWLRFDYFVEDLPLIPGFDEDKFNNNEIYMTKELSQCGMPRENMVYSLETCQFISTQYKNLIKTDNVSNGLLVPAEIVEKPNYKIGDFFTNNQGKDFTIIDINNNEYTIRFLASGHDYTVDIMSIYNGNIKDQNINIGDIFTNNQGKDFEIISKVNNKSDYLVRFIESGYETNASYVAVMGGYIIDKSTYQRKYDVGCTFTNNDGLDYIIIQRYDSSKVRVKFNKSGNEYDVFTSHILGGLIRDSDAYDFKYDIGKKFLNNKGLEMVIIEKYNDTKVRVRFTKSGYETDTEMSAVNRGEVKDQYEPSIYNIGYIGDFDGNVKYMKEYRKWHGMLERCYNPEDSHYNSYGGKGVTVCERWLNFTNFFNDIHHLPGYDHIKFQNGELELDKDLKQFGQCENKVYSPETCVLIPKCVNEALRQHPRDISITNDYIYDSNTNVYYNGFGYDFCTIKKPMIVPAIIVNKEVD